MQPLNLARLDESLLAAVLSFLDGKGLVRIGRASRAFRAHTFDEDDPRGHAAQIWRNLCTTYGYHQVGTRTRNFLDWSKLYASCCCVECADAGTVFITDRALPWRNGRFALCRGCIRTCNLVRIASRPEIDNDSTKLSHVLFRITTVRRELTEAKKTKRPRPFRGLASARAGRRPYRGSSHF